MDLDSLSVGERLMVDPEFQKAFLKYVEYSGKVGCVPWGRYVTREEVLRRCEQAGDPLDYAEWLWQIIKFNRYLPKRIPLKDVRGEPFAFQSGVHWEAESRLLDLEQSRSFNRDRRFRPAPAAPEWMREAALRDEAIATCVLDGVPVDRGAAREMLESGRGPRSREEQAVWQAHWSLKFVLAHPLFDPPSPEWILMLHENLTTGTTSIADAPGRLRRPGEASDGRGPAPADGAEPPADELPSRLHTLSQFLGYQNGLGLLDAGKATIAHFWMAYERPFVEGNGRMARLLHYWLLADRSHETRRPAALVSLSSLLARIGPTYSRWFRNVCADDNDLGYFLHPTLQLLTRGVKRVVETLDGVEAAESIIQKILPGAVNERQVDVLAQASRYPDRRFTVAAHRRRHGVVYQTARTDLLSLAELGMLTQSKEGRAFVFSAAPDLSERLKPHSSADDEEQV